MCVLRLSNMKVVFPLRFAKVAPRNVKDFSCAATIKHECRSSIVSCIPEVAPSDVNDVSCVATMKHECRIFIVRCIP